MPCRPTPITPPPPYKSSPLALLHSPYSPRSPLLPQQPQSRPAAAAFTNSSTITLSPPPISPLCWLWQCHLCNRVYRLAATRRCLEDGHFFCSGTTTVKRNRRTNETVVRHRACASEFDYQGWKRWGKWRRRVRAELLGWEEQETEGAAEFEPSKSNSVDEGSKKVPKKDCWRTCDYPSECRWGKTCGVHTPISATTPSSSSSTLTSTSELGEETASQGLARDEIVLDSREPENSSVQAVEHPVEQHLAPDKEAESENEMKPSMDDLLDSAKRRKRRSFGNTLLSPLSSNSPPPTTGLMSSQGSKADDGKQRATNDSEVEVGKSLDRATEIGSAQWPSPVRRFSFIEDSRTETYVNTLKSITKRGSWFG